MRFSVRRFVLGRPIPTWLAMQGRLPKVLALPIFASDATSSVAYATEEIVFYLGAAGAVGLVLTLPVTVAIIALLAIVATSYRQTIYAYPSGGGSYIVAHENLGVIPGLVAAASLLIDYTLTVSVSIASGVAAIIALAPAFGYMDASQVDLYRMIMCVGFITFVAFANLRGLRESGLLFAFPAYAYIASFSVLIVVGIFKYATGDLHRAPGLPELASNETLQTLSILLILKAFSGGCSAMTGTEAISNGVPAFRPPESRNAAQTLVIMAVVLGTLFFGISFLAQQLGITKDPTDIQTVVSQIARSIFGRDWFFWAIQIITAAILVLAAETSFAGFPRLASILARDRFMARQFANVGDRLSYTWGIIVLWALSSILVVAFKGKVTALIPLYAVGVFLSFTLSQTGMVVHTLRLKERGWRPTVVISTLGAITTGLVTIVQLVTKFSEGAWIVAVLIPLIVLMFLRIHRHYMILADQLRLPVGDPTPVKELRNTVLVLVPSIHKGVLPALQYAKSLSPDCRAIHIETDPADTPLIEERWEKWGMGVTLVVLESPYRSVVEPLLRYLNEVKKDYPEGKVEHVVTVIVPEFVPTKAWYEVLHNQTGIRLKLALLGQKDIVVTNIRYYLEK